MAKNKRPDNSDGKGRKPNRKLPAADRVKVKPIRRTPDEEEEAECFALLAHHWDILNQSQRKRAARCAFEQGRSVFEAFDGELPDGASYHEMYRRSAVRGANDIGVINDVEYECWRYETQDPRVIWFRRGFLSMRLEPSS
jgi:hypothetical protein